MKRAVAIVALVLAVAVPAVAGELLQVVTSESLAIGSPQGECLTVAAGADVLDFFTGLATRICQLRLND